MVPVADQQHTEQGAQQTFPEEEKNAQMICHQRAVDHAEADIQIQKIQTVVGLFF